MLSTLIWMLLYTVVANKLNLLCPHCNKHKVRGAGKTLIFGPLLRLNCSECKSKSRASFWLLLWNPVFALGILFVIANSYMKVDSRFIDLPSLVLMPAVLLIDLCVRFYFFKLKKA